MNKGFRRLAALGLAVTLSAVGLTACGGDDDGGSGSEGGTIKIGVLTALSGAAAVYGTPIVQGAKLAAEELNADGGVEGYDFEVIEEDHANDPDSAVTAAQKLLTVENVNALLSSFTAPTLAVRPLACEREVPILNGGAIGADLIGQECLYNTVANSVTMYPQLLEHAIEETGVTKVATIFWNDEAGNAINDEVSSTCEKLGCDVVAAESHEVGATDLSVQLARIKSESPELLVIGSYGDDLGYIIGGARDIGLNIPIVGNDFTPNALEIAGADAMEGYTAILDRFDATIDDPETTEFVAAYKKEYGEDATNFAANYYEHVKYVYAEAVKRAVQDGDDPLDTGVILSSIQALVEEGHEFPSLYGDSMVLNDDGTVDKPVAIYQVKGGALERVAEVGESE